MQVFLDFLHNTVLIITILAWVTAQVIKTIIDLCMNKKINPERLYGTGGMPSCHSAAVCAMCTSSGLVYGLSSFQFAITGLLAIIVMTDAKGVRQETGKQAVLLNQMMEYFKNLETPQQRMQFTQEKLKELVGHTPLQVLVGALVGVVSTLIYYRLIFYGK